MTAAIKLMGGAGGREGHSHPHTFEVGSLLKGEAIYYAAN